MSSFGAVSKSTNEQGYVISFAQIGKPKHQVQLPWDCRSAKVFFESLANLKLGDPPIFDKETRVLSKDEGAVSYNPYKFVRSKINRKINEAFNPNYLLSALEYVSTQRLSILKILPKNEEEKQKREQVYELELAVRMGVLNLSALEGYYSKKVISKTVINIQQTALDMFEKFPLFDAFTFWKFAQLETTLNVLKKWPTDSLAYFKRDADEISGEFVRTEISTSSDELFVIEAVHCIVRIFLSTSYLVKNSKDKLEGDWKVLQEYEPHLITFIRNQAELRKVDKKETVESKAWQDLANRLTNKPAKIVNASVLLDEIYERMPAKKALERMISFKENPIAESGTKEPAQKASEKKTAQKTKLTFDTHINQALAQAPAQAPSVLTQQIQKRHSQILDRKSSLSLDKKAFYEVFDDKEVEALFLLENGKELTQEDFIMRIGENHTKFYEALLERKKALSLQYVELTGKNPLERQLSENKLIGAEREKVMRVMEKEVFCSISVNSINDEFAVIKPDLSESYIIQDENAKVIKSEETAVIVLKEKTKVQITIIQNANAEWGTPEHVTVLEEENVYLELKHSIQKKIDTINKLLRMIGP